jgi:3-(methylthio)propionyl---CoA ligase
VFPGPALDGKSLYELFESEKVTQTAGVPTVWLGLLAYMKQNGLKFSTLKMAVVGGSACPPAMIETFRDEYGVECRHAWGMTEMSPLGSMCTLKTKHLDLPRQRKQELENKQGRTVYGVQMKIVDGEGKELPRDGKAFGALKVRGPWIASSYYRRDNDAAFEADGWFNTGDVATICPLGYMQITDRTKDVIKSGGEWISSIELENLAVAHPAVAQAAAIAIPHAKWQERPLLVVVLKPGASVTREELLEFYLGRVAKWWIPDDVVFVDKLPLTATGKLSKLQLRQQFADYRLSSE